MAKATSFDLQCNHETNDVQFFPLDALPSLSRKNSKKELDKALEVYKNKLDVYCD